MSYFSILEQVDSYKDNKNLESKLKALCKYKAIIIGEIHSNKMVSIYKKLLEIYKPDYFVAEFADMDRSYSREELKEKMDNATDGSMVIDPKKPVDYQYNYWLYKLAYDADVPLIGCNRVTNSKFTSMEQEDKFREPYMLSTISEFASKGKILVQLGDHHLRSIPISKEFLEYCNDTVDDRGIYKIIDQLTVSFSSPVWDKYYKSSSAIIMRVKQEYDNEIQFMKHIQKT